MTARGPTSPGSAAKPEGLRERKRNELYDRIVRVGHKLFMQQGYETTTIDMIAAEAKISRRTFFHYFPSKEDVLFTVKGEFEWMKEAAARCADDISPLAAVEHDPGRDCQEIFDARVQGGGRDRSADALPHGAPSCPL
jgi:AcrR family transcriptional regulator